MTTRDPRHASDPVGAPTDLSGWLDALGESDRASARADLEAKIARATLPTHAAPLRFVDAGDDSEGAARTERADRAHRADGAGLSRGSGALGTWALRMAACVALLVGAGLLVRTMTSPVPGPTQDSAPGPIATGPSDTPRVTAAAPVVPADDAALEIAFMEDAVDLDDLSAQADALREALGEDPWPLLDTDAAS